MSPVYCKSHQSHGVNFGRKVSENQATDSWLMRMKEAVKVPKNENVITEMFISTVTEEQSIIREVPDYIIKIMFELGIMKLTTSYMFIAE